MGGLAAAVVLVAAPARAGEAGNEAAAVHVDCRYPAEVPASAAAPDGSGGRAVTVYLPEDDLFRPLLADPRQPRLFATYARMRFRGAGVPAEGEGRTIDAGLVGLGGGFGLWGRRRRGSCDGVQVGVFGAIFSQFNLSAASADLLNTDFLVGPVLTARRGPLSGRLRVYHQSSHLGDEFLLNTPEVEREDLSFEAVDLLGSVEGRWWRLYAGGGAVVRDSGDPDIDPWAVQWGLELRGGGFRPWAWLKGTRLVPVFGADFTSVEERKWNVNASLVAGVEWSAPGGGRRVRLLLHYMRGASPYGQFLHEKIETVGVGLQFEF